METSYTSGPWKWEFIGTAGNYFLVGRDGQLTHDAPNSPDGNLKQAAPDLLEAAQEALAWIIEQEFDSKPYGVIDALESAIKRAAAGK